MNRNPYSLMFGKEPEEMISRDPQIEMVLEQFRAEPSSQQVFVITGVKGSGKTVLMTEISRRIQKDKNWIHITLNPEKDMLVMLAASLASENQLAEMFRAAEI